MMNRSLLFRFTLILAIAAMPIAAFAGNIGRASGGGSAIEWQLDLRGQAAIELTVIAPSGQDYSSVAKGGQNPSFRLSQLGQDLEDGQYNYELRAVPNVPSDVARKLEAARKAGDDAAARKIMKAAGLEPITQSGSFTVRNGSIVDPNAIEADANDSASISTRNLGVTTNARPSTPVVNDQVIADDLIVQGSGCFGFDCVNGESFGFDTIRLKENNLRIKAEDTSVGTFPTNDWQLTFNDSASGGASKFSVEDITGSKVPLTITAGATTNSIFVDSTGRVGFRTSTPVLDLHVATSNTPSIRLEQNNSGGFTAQTWDIAGNEANFFVRDVTSGSRLPFRIRPGAPTSSIDIAADGEVGIGTASPEAKLHVFGASNADTFVGIGNDPDGSTGTESAMTYGYSGSSFGRASGFFNIRPDSGAAAPNPSLRFLTGNNAAMIIDNQGFIGIGGMASGNPTNPIHYTNGGVTATLTTAGVWTDNSSRAAKEHIVDLDSEQAFKALHELKPVTYNYKVIPTDPKVGFIAEDVPDIVATPERNGLSALDIVAVVTKVVQEQQKTIEQLNERIAQLEKERQQ